MASESTRELGEAAVIVAEWLNSDDPGHTLLIESIARALRDARSSSTGWVPVGTPPECEDPNGREVMAAVTGQNGERYIVIAWLKPHIKRDIFWPLRGVTHWAEPPALPSDGETGGGR